MPENWRAALFVEVFMAFLASQIGSGFERGEESETTSNKVFKDS